MVTRPTDLHRVFIQTMLARRFARDEVGLELYRRAVNAVRGGSGHLMTISRRLRMRSMRLG